MRGASSGAASEEPAMISRLRRLTGDGDGIASSLLEGSGSLRASADISGIAGQNHDIIVRVSYPALPVVRPGVYTRVFNDCHAQPPRFLYRRIKRAHLKPEQNTKTVRCRVPVAKVCMPVNVPGVKLKNEFAVLHNLFVFIPAMTALATKQLLVPAAAAFHI